MEAKLKTDKVMSCRDKALAGPFASEQQFKRAAIDCWRRHGLCDDIIEIENEEKAPGMPDVLTFMDGCCALCEFKISDGKGVIKFQRTQPLFYKQHQKLAIYILAWDAPRSRVCVIQPSQIIEAKSLSYNLQKVKQ